MSMRALLATLREQRQKAKGKRQMTVLLCLAFCLFPFALAFGQAPETVYCKQPSFRIPFQIEPGEQPRLREVHLYVYEDASGIWRQYKTVGPEQKFFSFKAERDGVYNFLVRTLDVEGRFFPAALEKAARGLRVIVDPQPPTAAL